MNHASLLEELKEGGVELNGVWISFHSIPCHIVSAWMAARLANHTKSGWLVETEIHSVAWDGVNTWDLRYGLLFLDYLYPNKNPPNPQKIWNCSYKPKFYSELYLGLARDSLITYTKMYAKKSNI